MSERTIILPSGVPDDVEIIMRLTRNTPTKVVSGESDGFEVKLEFGKEHIFKRTSTGWSEKSSYVIVCTAPKESEK